MDNMPVRIVALTTEPHGKALRLALQRPTTFVMNRGELAGATVLGGAIAFISFDLLATIDPTTIPVPVVAIYDTTPKSSLQDSMRVFAQFPWVSHAIALPLIESPNGPPHLTTLLDRLEVGADQRQLGATGRGRKALLTTASRREARLERIATSLRRQNAPPGAVKTILVAAEELVMNALYDAPLEAGYFERPYLRSEDVVLPDHLACEISYGIDNDNAFVALRDPFGSLTRGRLMEVLERCRVEGGAVDIDPSRGGAGLGLWRVFSGATTLAIHVIPGTLTEIFVGFSIVDGRKGLRSAGVDLFFSRMSPAEDPFAPMDDSGLLDNSITIVMVA